MRGRCDICAYNTGEQPNVYAVQAKINADGGEMTSPGSSDVPPPDWVIRCPQCNTWHSMCLGESV